MTDISPVMAADASSNKDRTTSVPNVSPSVWYALGDPNHSPIRSKKLTFSQVCQRALLNESTAETLKFNTNNVDDFVSTKVATQLPVVHVCLVCLR